MTKPKAPEVVALPVPIPRDTVVRELSKLYAQYGLEAKGPRRDAALAAQAALSQAMVRLGVVEACKERLKL